MTTTNKTATNKTATSKTATKQKEFDRLCVVVDDPTRTALAILARSFGCNLSATVRYAILHAPQPTNATDKSA